MSIRTKYRHRVLRDCRSPAGETNTVDRGGHTWFFAVVLLEIKTLGETKGPSETESLSQPWLIPINM